MSGFHQAKDEAGDGSAGDGAILDGVSSSIKATVFDLTSSNPIATAIVDGDGVQITSFGGGTQYTEGDTDASITGTAVMWEDGSNTLRAASAAKPLPVEIIAGAGSGGTASADDADFTAGTTNGTPAMGVYESSPTSVTDGDMGIVGITVGRRLKTSATIDAALPAGTNNIGDVDVLSSALPTGAATSAKQDTIIGHVDGIEGLLGTIDADTGNISTKIDTLAGAVSGSEMQVDVLTMPTVTVNAHAVTNAGTFAVQVDGAALTALQLIDDAVYAEDVAAQAADKGLSVLAVRRDTASTMVGADNDYTNLIVDGSGRLHVNVGNTVTVASHAVTNAGTFAVQVDAALPAGSNAIGKLAANSGVDIGDVDVTTVGTITPGTAASSLGKAEDAAHSSGDVGVFALGVRVDSPNVALTNTDADYSPIGVNKLGSVRVAIPEDDLATAATTHVKKYYTNAGAVTDGIVWSPAAGKRWFVTDIFINVSAAATVTLEDDLAAGDSAVWKAELAANSGWSHAFNTPLYSGEDAADLLITTSAGNVYVSVTGYEI